MSEYVGDWHTHTGPSLQHSEGYVDAMAVVQASHALGVAAPVSLIYAPSLQNFVVYVYKGGTLAPLPASLL